MEKKLNIWNDYQNQKNYDLSFKTENDNPPDHIILKESKDDRGKNGEQWNFKIVSKDYIDTKNAEQDETARQQQAQITEHDHKIREQEEKIIKIEEKNTEQDNKITEIETKNTEQDNEILEIKNKNTEQDTKLEEHKNRLDELDGGHNSNLGKIGEIETKIENHKDRLESLESETNEHSPRVYRQNLPNMELKKENSIVKCTVDILAERQDEMSETITVHLSGILTVDKKNNHNNILQLLPDNIYNGNLYDISITNDDSLLVNIVHSKKIIIKSVNITEYSQIFEQKLPTINETVKWYSHNSHYRNNTKDLVFCRTEITEMGEDYCIVKGVLDFYAYSDENEQDIQDADIFYDFDNIYPKEALKKYFSSRMENFPELQFTKENGELIFINQYNRKFGEITERGGYRIPLDYSKRSHHIRIYISAELGRYPTEL